MEFEGFIVEYLIPPRHSNIPMAFIYCQNCGAKAPREADYMRDVCTEISCPTCGNHSVRTSASTMIEE